jgi:ATP-dependent helicase/nuclease subunit B
VQARLLLGPAGSGKTFRCLAEIRATLENAVDGPPLLLIAPKQTTYQLERQLLADPSLPGYTRLHILSFERLANFVFKELGQAPPQMLSDEGRLMVLRALLAKKRDSLKLFRASARLTGFAQHLSQVLRELQAQQLTPENLLDLAEQTSGLEGLSLKLQDLATLLRDYLDWLKTHELQDADRLLPHVTETLRTPHRALSFAGIWVDGFTEFSPQEMDLLVELLPQATQATITFCLDRVPAEKVSWLSNWSSVETAYHRCHKKLSELADYSVQRELLPRRAGQGRFANSPVLHHLEAHWADSQPSPAPANVLGKNLRVANCANPEAEATLAAREILRFVRAGGRYREVTVLARSLLPYHEILVTVFNRYEIPFFLDRRESVSHHPLAELTRNALRTVAYSWAHEDWFAALKTGLVPADEGEIDRLENEALARGWKGKAWQQPLSVPDYPELEHSLEKLRLKILPPFNKLALQLARQNNKPTGAQLAEALRDFWSALGVAETLQTWSADEADPRAIHLTVWDQMSAWLENLVLAFPTEPLALREWLPILEAGLAGLTVGVIPPALDQVSIGAIDRSRNPDIRLAIALGMNETIFPAPPVVSVLLTDADRLALEKEGIPVVNARQRLSQERFYAYVAFTRARERLVLTASESDSDGKTLNPSPFLAHLRRLFPLLESEEFPRSLDWRKSEHATELIVPLLQNQIQVPEVKSIELSRLNKLPELAAVVESLGHFVTVSDAATLSPALAAQLYGAELRTSVSRMEQFAACPFKFFVHSGLRAEERELFELDYRDQGNFQHEILAFFHQQLVKEGKRWRDITPAEARERIKSIAAAHAVVFRDGLLQSTEKGKFTARVLTEALQNFVETIIDWMRTQYAFDPSQVELPFGGELYPPWQLNLGDGRTLALHGRIDRVDLYSDSKRDEALCVVVDYKSSQKKLDAVLMEHGLQLQLPAYLNVLRQWRDPCALFGVSRLVPVGVFYVNLRGRYESSVSRADALKDVASARKEAYCHTGRFDASALPELDQRPGATSGDQFSYSRKKDGSLAKSAEALTTPEFTALLDHVEHILAQMGRQIYSGVVKVDPYRKGNITACDHCDYRAVCRIDPWTHNWRVLRKSVAEEAES